MNVAIDSNGNVLRLSPDAITPGPGESVVVVADTSLPYASYQPDGLFDEAGRLKWKVQGAAVVAQPARWPATAILKRAAAKRLRNLADEVLLKVVAIERWQADPANVVAYDRSQELTAAQARLVELREILTGP